LLCALKKKIMAEMPLFRRRLSMAVCLIFSLLVFASLGECLSLQGQPVLDGYGKETHSWMQDSSSAIYARVKFTSFPPNAATLCKARIVRGTLNAKCVGDWATVQCSMGVVPYLRDCGALAKAESLNFVLDLSDMNSISDNLQCFPRIFDVFESAAGEDRPTSVLYDPTVVGTQGLISALNAAKTAGQYTNMVLVSTVPV